MKRITILLLLIVTSHSISLAQSSEKPIERVKVFGGYQFYQGNQGLSMKQMVEIMQPNEAAYMEMKSARSNSILGSVIGFAGGFMVGFPLGSALAGGEPNWALAGVGAALIVVSIPISSSASKKAVKAVDIYNSSLQTSSIWDNKALKLALTGNGVGLTLSF